MIEDKDLSDVFQPVLMLKEVPQDTKAHPEHENVFIHITRAMDDAAKIADTEGLSEDDRLVLIFASLFHDMGKGKTTRIVLESGASIPYKAYKDSDGPIVKTTSEGHETACLPEIKHILKELEIKKNLRRKIVALVQYHMQPAHLSDESKIPESRLVEIIKGLDKVGAGLNLLKYVHEADVYRRRQLYEDGGMKILKRLNEVKDKYDL